MLKGVAVAIWTIGAIIFAIVIINGGWAAWVGLVLCLTALVLTILNWGNSDDPHDWSV
jgi:hypothetical protein